VSEDRMDRLERIVSNLADTVQANSQGIAELRASVGDLRASVADLRADHADVLEGLRLQMQFLREEQDRRAEMQQEMVRNERRYLEIREDIQMMQSEIRGLQIQANRILDRLEGGGR